MAEKKKNRITNEDIENSPILKAAADNFFQFVDIVKGAEPFANEELSKIIYEKGTITQVVRYRDILDSFPVSFHFLLSLLETYNTNDKAGISQAIKNHIIEEYGEEDTELETILAAIYRAIINYNNEKSSDALDTKHKKQVKPLTLLQAVNPQHHIIPNSTLMNYLQSRKVINEPKGVEIPVIKKRGKKKEITTYTLVSYDDKMGNEKIKLSEYERQVANSINSIWDETVKQNMPSEFTIDMVFRGMPGGGDKPSPQQARDIAKVIQKFRDMTVYIDATEEMRAKGIISEEETLIYNDKFISAAMVECRIKNGGQKVVAYHLHAEPIVLEYSRRTNQIITVSADLLEVKKVKAGKATTLNLPMTQQRQEITGYILRRIAVMKRDKKNKKPNQSNVILFSTLYEVIGVKDPDKQKAADTRNFCFKVLDFYKTKKYIKDYEKQTKGRSITGIIIDL